MSEQVEVKVDQVQLPWSRELPTKPGWYLFKPLHQEGFALYLMQENKSLFYFSKDKEEAMVAVMPANDIYEATFMRLRDIDEPGWWCGPLAEPTRH